MKEYTYNIEAHHNYSDTMLHPLRSKLWNHKARKLQIQELQSKIVRTNEMQEDIKNLWIERIWNGTLGTQNLEWNTPDSEFGTEHSELRTRHLDFKKSIHQFEKLSNDTTLTKALGCSEYLNNF